MTRPATTTAPTSAANHFLIHGNPGSAKTPFALSYPCSKMLVVPCDRKRVNLPLPDDGRYVFANYAEAPDPYTFIKSVLTYDWRTEGIDAICIDTISTLGGDYLQAAINSGSFNSKVVSFGKETVKLSDKPHFNLAHNLMDKTIGLVLKCPIPVLVVAWSCYDDPTDGQGAFGGPLGVNHWRSREIAGEFDNILYLNPTPGAGGRPEYNVHTQTSGIWTARLNGVHPNPVPKLTLGTDLGKTWEQILGAMKPA